MRRQLQHAVNALAVSLEIESKSPLVRVRKWGASGFNVGIPGASPAAKIETKDLPMGGIEHVVDGTAHRVFQLPDESGLEILQILASRPKSNVLRYDINSDNLDLIYQPSLTAEEIAEGCERPDNIVGSYAVYETRPRNGDFFKVGHFFRPEAWDAAGHRIWCDMRIAGGDLLVEVPREFLDSAVYPITVDPTFGYTSSPATASATANNRWYATKGTPAGNGTVDWIKAYLKIASAGTEYFKGMLVLGSDKTIVSSGVGPATAVTNTTPAWLQCDYSSKPSVSAVDYWVGAIMSVTTVAISFYFDDAGSNTNAAYDTSNNYGTPTNPTDLATQNRYYGFYGSYTADAGSVVIPVMMNQYRQRWN